MPEQWDFNDQREIINTEKVMPETLVNMALSLTNKGNIGIAYTYNEPMISYEYVMDSARLAKEKGLKNVVVTNGYICKGLCLNCFPL